MDDIVMEIVQEKFDRRLKEAVEKKEKKYTEGACYAPLFLPALRLPASASCIITRKFPAILN